MVAIASRLTVNLVTKADAALNWLTEHTGHNRTDIVNRALQLYQYLEEAKAKGYEPGLVDGNGVVRLVHFI